jgi:hypothetical protein
MSAEQRQTDPNWSAPRGSERRDPIAEGRELGGPLPDPAPIEHDREDDVRGEHKYPAEDRIADRPSQLQRDRLKARMALDR